VTVEGTVEAVNGTGVKVGGNWLNSSRYHPIDLSKLDAGARVRLEVDAKGFIKEMETLSAALDKTPAVLSDKDQRITRLAVLKAAAEFVGLWGQTREEVKSEHVLVIAQRWLEWVEAE
jgi:hypothetical protein